MKILKTTPKNVRPIPFERYKTGKPIETWGYHWKEGRRKLEGMDNRFVFFCDDKNTWDSPHMTGIELILFRIRLQSPMVLIKDKRWFETDIYSKKYFNLLLSNGFDALIYTPGKGITANRQGLLLNPKQQIIFATSLGKRKQRGGDLILPTR